MTEIWTKPLAPILTATLPWENNCVCEPAVYYNAALSRWEMFYGAGWNAGQIGRAVCAGDPTIASNWVKNPNPVIGPGAGNFWTAAAHQDVLVNSGGYHIFFSTTGSNAVNMWLADSTDGITFAVRPVPIMPNPFTRVMGNSCLFVDNDPDSTHYNLFDAVIEPAQGGSGIWQTYLARAARPGGPWVEDERGVITTLQIPGGGTACGWSMRKVNGKYNVWGINAPSGNTPSYIYHHYSYEMINWGVLNNGNPVLSITNEHADQIADPCVIDSASYGGANSLMFYDTILNSNGTGSIWVATMPGPLSAVCP